MLAGMENRVHGDIFTHVKIGENLSPIEWPRQTDIKLD